MCDCEYHGALADCNEKINEVFSLPHKETDKYLGVQQNKGIYKGKQRGCLPLDANKHIHIYIIYLYEAIIINIIFHGVSIARILKYFLLLLSREVS